ncbi:hypothetical protein SNEBB_006861 [Seison nebaliae]|nr:hypothetical protein SNEBB_006861 [Seison nebaliae]
MKKFLILFLLFTSSQSSLIRTKRGYVPPTNIPRDSRRLPELKRELASLEMDINFAKDEYEMKKKSGNNAMQIGEINFLHNKFEILINKQYRLDREHDGLIGELINQYDFKIATERKLKKEKNNLSLNKGMLNNVRKNIEVIEDEINDKQYQIELIDKENAEIEEKLFDARERKRELNRKINHQQKVLNNVTGNSPHTLSLNYYDTLELTRAKEMKNVKERTLDELERKLRNVHEKMLSNTKKGNNWEYLLFLKAQKKHDLVQNLEDIEENLGRMQKRQSDSELQSINYLNMQKNIEREIDYLSRKKYVLMNTVRMNKKSLQDIKTNSTKKIDEIFTLNATVQHMDKSIAKLRQQYYMMSNSVSNLRNNVKRIKLAIDAKKQETIEAKANAVMNTEPDKNYKKIEETLNDFLNHKKAIKSSINDALTKRYAMQDQINDLKNLQEEINTIKNKIDGLKKNENKMAEALKKKNITVAELEAKYGKNGKLIGELLKALNEVKDIEKEIDILNKNYTALAKKGRMGDICDRGFGGLNIKNALSFRQNAFHKTLKNLESFKFTCPNRVNIAGAELRTDLHTAALAVAKLEDIKPCSFDVTSAARRICSGQASCTLQTSMKFFGVPEIFCLQSQDYLQLVVSYTCTDGGLGELENRFIGQNGFSFLPEGFLPFGSFMGDRFIIGTGNSWEYKIPISKDSFDRRYGIQSVVVGIKNDMTVELTTRMGKKRKFTILDAEVDEYKAYVEFDYNFGSCNLLPSVVYFREIKEDEDKKKVMTILALLNRGRLEAVGNPLLSSSIFKAGWVFTSTRIKGRFSQVIIVNTEQATVGVFITKAYQDDTAKYTELLEMENTAGEKHSKALIKLEVDQLTLKTSNIQTDYSLIALPYPGYIEPEFA